MRSQDEPTTDPQLRSGARCSLLALALALGVALAAPVAGTETQPAAPGGDPRPSYHVQRLEGSVAVDGSLDETVWRHSPTFELTYETRPAENGPAPVQTKVWITYDDSSLYLAFRAFDPDADKIRARLTDRDRAYQDDFVGVALDTFNDERRAFEFFVNPLGVQMDMVQNEITGNEDDSWDTIWDSAGRVLADGYSVEMRIPFSSLRFPKTEAAMTWGIDAIRFYPRDQRYRLSINPLERGNNCYLCQLAKLTGISGAEPARSIELDPTLTSSQNATRVDGQDGTLEADDPETEPGLTARWGITPNMILSGAVNPDFSQVEADTAQLDVNTQFALFYPEKRPLFLEGADIFETRFNAIYSRNIADPDWGLKLTGKEGRNAIGVIVAKDRQTNFLIPSSQDTALASVDQENLSTIVRYRRDLFGATTGGFFVTDREGNGFYNRVVGGDVLFRWADGAKAARIELLGSQTKDPDAIAADYGGHSDAATDWAARIVYQYTARDYSYYVLYREIGEDFRADLGFVPQNDLRQGTASAERYWYPDERSWSQAALGAELNHTEDHAGNVLDRSARVYGWASGPRQSFLQLAVRAGDQFYGGRTFDADRADFFGEVQAWASVYLRLEGSYGDQIDFANVQQAEQLRLEPGLRLDLGRHLRLTLDHSFERLDVGGLELYTANLTEMRATYQLNVRTFVRLITQYFDIERDTALYKSSTEASDRHLFNQLLFSFKLNPQTMLFLGYSDNSVGSESLDLTRQDRTLFFKVGYAWLV
jgi:hypothetical protein